MWVSKESPTKYCIGYRTWCVCALIASFPFPLYMEMKRSFMLFPLVALFIAVWRFISWFHLRFRRLFLGKPLKCVSDSKQSSSCFLSPLAFSLMKKKKINPRFSKWNETHCEAKIYPALSLGRGMLFLFLWLTWKENRGFSLSLALLASLVQYGWTSNEWLPVICVTIEATWALFMLCVALWMRWGGFVEGGRYVSDAATRWWGYTWFKTRLAGRWRGKLQLQDKVRAVISQSKTGMLHSAYIPTCTHPEILTHTHT